eukprot:scaffold84_cov163-Amphora_coffeaeformis.AAC.25
MDNDFGYIRVVLQDQIHKISGVSSVWNQHSRVWDMGVFSVNLQNSGEASESTVLKLLTDGCGVDALTLEREHEQGTGTGNWTENLIPFKTRISVPLMNQNSADVAHLSPSVTHLFRSTLQLTVNGLPSTL